MQRNWEALVLRAMGGRNFRLTVLGTESVGDGYRRLRLDGGGLLEACDIHPTMWVRLWFDNDGKAHQRAYTLVDPDPATGTFDLVFALHDGCAARWASGATPGDTIDATVQGTGFRWPDPPPRHVFAVGDAASLPAVNSLLDAAGDSPATVWLEYAHEAERVLPVRSRAIDTVHWLPRQDGGRLLLDTVKAGLRDADGAFYWVAAEAASTRALARHLRKDLGVDKHRVCALGYWSAA
ncbi:siderophore-interacting protein [Dactylosporangium vinaceum]|uniref:Siderophore-interacting protein n=1 Tax=Dactylosporangium vinaceum TaxID=53362 RepID=A0ABV5M8F2_9ACTN|nr:siderophore-interacting protein [Dactylosporangium vinaceum]UAB94209.1 siderophore-interacting protein [Dactylosporangium vinaceum]